MFKSSNGQLLTRSLFWDVTPDITKNLYTTQDDDKTLSNGRIIIALRWKYLDIGDITEYKFAREYFFSWDHWLMIADSSWFTETITLWRDDLKQKVLSDNFYKLKELSEGTGPVASSAAKYLHNWASKTRVGRPNKTKSEGQISHDNLTFQKQLEQDFINLKGLN